VLHKLVKALLCCSLFTMLVAVADGQAPAPQKGKGKAPAATPADASKSPFAEQIRGKWRAWFKKWDKDGDGFMDKEELAHAFGYRHAFDYEAPPKEEKSTKDGDKKDAEKKDEEKKDEEKKDDKAKKDAKDKKDKDDVTDPESQKNLKSMSKKNWSRADAKFLAQCDKDDDEKISLEELMTYVEPLAIDYASKVEAMQQAQRLAQMQQMLAMQSMMARLQQQMASRAAQQRARNYQNRYNQRNPGRRPGFGG
jgi:Ca2+-binding EF-hand superfamily protein